MAQNHIDTLKKLRAKVVEQRRAMALRQSGASQNESVEHMTNLQVAIESIDRAIADERLMVELEENAAQAS
jgi:hypothetical protein